MPEIETLLVFLRIKGFGKAESLAWALGVTMEASRMRLDELKALGQAEDTRVGARLTPAGRTRADAILAAERASVDTATVSMENAHFTPVNGAFKHLITRWQIREVDGKPVRNDHSDAAHDAIVLADLDSVHRDVGDIIAGIARALARFGAYRSRLDAALGKVRSGDVRYLVAPDVESYHTIWSELHQDLIGLSGTRRAKEAAGRAL